MGDPSPRTIRISYDLAKKKTLTITPEGRQPIVVSLAGSDAAFKALRACQDAQKPG